MKELSTTQKVLIGAGAVVIAAAATYGAIVVAKKLKKNKNLAVIEFDEDGDEIVLDDSVEE